MSIDSIFEALEERINELNQRIDDLEEETGIAQKRRDKAERREQKATLVNLYLHENFSQQDANALARADMRQGRSFDQAAALLGRKQREKRQREEDSRLVARAATLRLIISHLRNMRRTAITIEREEEYIRAIKAAHPEELIREALGICKISLIDWGYANEHSDK